MALTRYSLNEERKLLLALRRSQLSLDELLWLWETLFDQRIHRRKVHALDRIEHDHTHIWHTSLLRGDKRNGQRGGMRDEAHGLSSY